VPYPASARGSGAVVLELRIDREGHVTESRVIDGDDPFASAARDAAASWLFDPARRDGAAVEARIRIRVDFTPPPAQEPAPVSPGAAAPATAPSSPTAPPGETQVQEVTVHGVRPEPGRQEMSGGEVRQMPGSFGDAFRAIEALPGVIPLVSGLPYFLVRGAPPGNTGFFVDGVRVPALFHLGVGAAIIHPGLIDKVDFYPGAYPARYGRFTGGILSGEVLPAPERPHGEASVRLLDAGALASAPLAEGRGDVLASGRYGYPGPLLSLFAKDTSLGYWDYQARARWRASEKDEIGAFVFGSYDSLSVRNSNSGQWVEVLGIQFHRADLRWDRRTSDTGTLRVALTLGYDRSATGDGSNAAATDSVESETVALRATWSDRAGPNADLVLGADAILEPYRVNVPYNSPISGPSTSTIGSSAASFLQTDVDASAYGELVWRPAPRVELRPGLRLDAFTAQYPGNGTFLGIAAKDRAVGAVDPRLAARWDATPTLSWVAALGVAHQASNIPFPSPGLQFSQLSRGLQSAFQYSAGAEVKLPADFTATGDVFLHDYTGLADYIETCPPGEATCTFNGRSIGLELLVRRPLTKRFTGWLSYTLSRTERDAFYSGSWMRRLSEFDRPHVVNLVLAADLGKRWRVGGRLLAYSGLPYSSVTGTVGPPDSRGDPFYRIDLRVEKKWNALGGTMALVFEWLNALLNKETIGTSCSESFTGSGFTSQCAPTKVGPITFPSIGLEAAW
jgi:TonB family protein